MTQGIWGIVKEGVIIPETPLPEGTRVEIIVNQVSPELHEELQQWESASSNALALVERLAEEAKQHEKS